MNEVVYYLIFRDYIIPIIVVLIILFIWFLLWVAEKIERWFKNKKK